MFKLFYTITHNLATLTTESSANTTTQLQCATVCATDLRCGGFIWYASQVPSCALVVDPSVADSTEHLNDQVYRLENYGEEYLLLELPQPTSSWQNTYDTCKAKQLDMVPMPKTLRDRAILSIRPVEWLSLDLKRSADGEYIDSHGTVLTNTSVLTWGGSNPTYGEEACIGIGYSPLAFYDQLCHHTTHYYVLCVKNMS
ncbi:hypothetical protein FHG87_007295 [Trinorchestia longiramus]|nr:hypothetical protein FHG87_007295 [Trinorchestia longiramus]